MTHFLILKKRALGDSIMGLSSVQYLKNIYPNWKVTYAVPKWVLPLYSQVETSADSIIAIEDGLSYYSELLTINPDAIHELHQTGSSGKLNSTFSIFRQIPYTFHNHHFKGKSPIKDQGKPIATIQRDLNGIHAFWGKGEPPCYLDFPPIIKTSNTTKKSRVIIGAVATRRTKMWPLEYVRELTSILQGNGIEVSIPVAPNDYFVKNALKELPLVEIPLANLPEFFAESALYVGNDTGIKHLAVAVGLPTLTFFGPENPNEWHPYNTDKHPFYFIEDLECRTRTSHYCGLSTCDSMICLNQFMPKIVAEKIFEMIG